MGKYYIELNITNLENRELVNQTFNVTIPAVEIPLYSKLKAGNVYVLDSSGKPLYFWVMRRTSKVFTVFFRVSRIPPGGWAVVRIYYGSTNPYRRYRKPEMLFVYFNGFNRLGDYPHVDTGIFDDSKNFESGELRVRNGKLIANSTIWPDFSSWDVRSVSKEVELTRFKVNDRYAVVFKFKRRSDVQYAESYPFYMFIHAKVGNRHRYDYIAVKENANSKFLFEFGNDRAGTVEINKKVGKQYYIGEILVTPTGSWGRVEKFSSGKVIAWHSFENRGRFRNREVSVGFGQANVDWFPVELTAYVDWVYVMRTAEYRVKLIGFGGECEFN
ncbi:hypothetical protein [Thermococcus sp. 9N3]|uniref:hypothetical protein n=1 Tax=Thermococcus sp. 9N3 TaxID=163002 RepID=UPI001431B5F7|nr:hypothetical protein [Thermococcus sp. 9N3]NJE49702.1 hypothetical protein [Thermococcus sp. 9N3]